MDNEDYTGVNSGFHKSFRLSASQVLAGVSHVLNIFIAVYHKGTRDCSFIYFLLLFSVLNGRDFDETTRS